MILTDKINELMKQNNINRMELSRGSGVPYMTIVNFYERGTENVKLSTLKKIAAYFECSLDDLASDEVIELTSREMVLKILIEKTGLSLKAFAEKIDIPYTTLYSMLERGVGKASFDNVLKICKGLGITAEEMERVSSAIDSITIASILAKE